MKKSRMSITLDGVQIEKLSRRRGTEASAKILSTDLTCYLLAIQHGLSSLTGPFCREDMEAILPIFPLSCPQPTVLKVALSQGLAKGVLERGAPLSTDLHEQDFDYKCIFDKMAHLSALQIVAFVDFMFLLGRSSKPAYRALLEPFEPYSEKYDEFGCIKTPLPPMTI